MLRLFNAGIVLVVLLHSATVLPKTMLAQSVRAFVDPDLNTAKNAWLTEFPDLRTNEGGLGEQDLGDLIRMQRTLLDTNEMVDLLKPLNVRMKFLIDDAATKGKTMSATAALSAALDEKEALHGFPGAKLLPLGVLPAELFNSLPARGFIVKDTGAGMKHGEYTHRLQWYAIMTKFERAPRDWRRTPFELFTSIGLRDMKVTAADPSKTTNLWAHLMDKSAGTSEDPAVPQEGFRRPDDVVDFFRDLNKKADAGQGDKGVDLVARAVASRYAKRLSALNDVAARIMAMDTPSKARLAMQLGVKPKVITINGIKSIDFDFTRVADAEYRVRKLKSGSYSLFDPDDPELPLLVKGAEGSDLAAIERENDSVARYLRTNVFNMRLLPEQEANQAQEISEARKMRMKPLSQLRMNSSKSSRTMLPINNASKATTSSKSTSATTKTLDAANDPDIATKFNPDVRPPTETENQELREPLADKTKLKQQRMIANATIDSPTTEKFPSNTLKSTWVTRSNSMSVQSRISLTIEPPPNRRPPSITGPANRVSRRSMSQANLRTSKPGSQARSSPRIANQRPVSPTLRSNTKPSAKAKAPTPQPTKPKSR